MFLIKAHSAIQPDALLCNLKHCQHWYDQLFLVSHDVAFSEITDQLIQVGE